MLSSVDEHNQYNNVSSIKVYHDKGLYLYIESNCIKPFLFDVMNGVNNLGATSSNYWAIFSRRVFLNKKALHQKNVVSLQLPVY